jgi:hypothetical protein
LLNAEAAERHLRSIRYRITRRKRAEEEREKLVDELQESLKEDKTLRGILPLCSFCKKIRDDKGYWEQVDVYIHKHSQLILAIASVLIVQKSNTPI